MALFTFTLQLISHFINLTVFNHGGKLVHFSEVLMLVAVVIFDQHIVLGMAVRSLGVFGSTYVLHASVFLTAV